MFREFFERPHNEPVVHAVVHVPLVGVAGEDDFRTKTLDEFLCRLDHRVAGEGQIGPRGLRVRRVVGREHDGKIRMRRVFVGPYLAGAAVRESEEKNILGGHAQMHERRLRFLHPQFTEI